MMKCVIAILIGLTALLVFPVLGAVGGWYAEFYLMGIPEGPHCGLAVMPAILAGGLGAFLGIMGGGACGMAFFETIVEHQNVELDDDDEV